MVDVYLDGHARGWGGTATGTVTAGEAVESQVMTIIIIIIINNIIKY